MMKTCTFGRLASGNIWNKDKKRIQFLNEKYNVICEDMESISIYKTANLLEVPAICIRGISNNEVLEENYDASVGKELQLFVEKLIEKLIAF